jgi:hypothetical protein
MSRVAFFKPRTTNHVKDASSSYAVEKFLEAMTLNSHRFKWYGSRTSDLQSLQCHFEGFSFKFIRMLSKDHPLYREGGGIDFDKRKNEVLIKVSDISERYGRVNVLDERFNESSPLFRNADTTFESIWSTATILNGETHSDRMGYASAVHSLTMSVTKNGN